MTRQPEHQERSTGANAEAEKKRERSGEDDQETEAPSIKRQAVAGNANDQENTCVSNFLTAMSSEHARLDTVMTAIRKFKTNTGHLIKAMKTLFENNIEERLNAGFGAEGGMEACFSCPSLNKVSKWLRAETYEMLIADPDWGDPMFLSPNRLRTYWWACAIREILHENTGFDLKWGSLADDDMLPMIWRTVLSVQGGLIDDWMTKHKADGRHKVKKDEHGTEYLNVEIWDILNKTEG